MYKCNGGLLDSTENLQTGLWKSSEAAHTERALI